MLFGPLAHDEVREIAKHYLAQVTLTLAKAGKTMQVDDDALELIVTKGYNIAFGARFLKRVIDEQIKLPISARWKEGSHFIVKAVEGEIVVEAAPAHLVSAADVIAIRRRRLKVRGFERFEGSRFKVRILANLSNLLNPEPFEPLERKPTCSGSCRCRTVSGARSRLAFAQAVTRLQHLHHPLHFLSIGVRRIFLRVQLLESRRHRRKLALDELHEMRARSVLQVHHVAADEPRAVVGDRLDGPFELRARR